eukprot:483527-Rhodomonas_salina.1
MTVSVLKVGDDFARGQVDLASRAEMVSELIVRGHALPHGSHALSAAPRRGVPLVVLDARAAQRLFALQALAHSQLTTGQTAWATARDRVEPVHAVCFSSLVAAHADPTLQRTFAGGKERAVAADASTAATQQKQDARLPDLLLAPCTLGLHPRVS